MFVDNDTAPWVWEYSTLDGTTTYSTSEYASLNDLRMVISACFFDYTWEEVERRGIYGTSVLVKRDGRYVDTGHWVYRKSAGAP